MPIITPSETRAAILRSSERAFDQYGFAATGVDRLTEAAGVSTRTFYKHVGSKNALAAAVLEERAARFFAAFTTEDSGVDTVDALFAALSAWTEAEGARGCLFLRAQSDLGGTAPEVGVVVVGYRDRLRELVRRVVAIDLGHDDEALADQILVLVEGATSAASYLGGPALAAARRAARVLVHAAR